GFQSTVIPGGAPSPPQPTPPGLLALFTRQLDGQAGRTGGAAVVPTDAVVADSGISQAISTNVVQNVQSTLQPTSTNPVLTTVTSTLQSSAAQNAPSASKAAGSTSSPPPVRITTTGFAGAV